MKKNLFILTMLLCIAVIPEAFAYNFQSGGIYYDITGTSPNTVAVTYATGSYNSYSGNVDIPSTVTYNGTTYTVTAIGNSAFRNCSNLTGVTIPNTVTSIGEYAFYSSGINSATIPNAMESIGTAAFGCCYSLVSFVFNADSCIFSTDGGSIFSYQYYPYSNTNLTSLVIGNNVRVIPDYAFFNLTGIDTVIIPNSVKTIGDYAFNNCAGLKSIHFGNQVATIGHNAFRGCVNLESLNIPSSVSTIGDFAFRKCISLLSITVESGNPNFDSRNNCNAIISTETNTLVFGCKNTVIPNTIETIGDYAFIECSTLSTMPVFPNSVHHIGQAAYSQCTGLTGTLTISDYIKTIGNSAFYECSGLSSAVIGRAVESIGGRAFESCGLSSVVFNADSCSTMGNVSSLYVDAYVFSYNPIISLTIGNKVKRIPDNAFANLGIASLNIPNSVRYIGNSAFTGCSTITGMLILPDSVTYIGDGAFSGCTGITGVLSIPNSVTYIGNTAFSGCSGITGGLTIPNSVTSIGEGAFEYCSISSVAFNADSCSCPAYNESPFNNCHNLKILTIGNTVKILPNFIFRQCDSLCGELAIPNTVKYIGKYAFYGCTGLTGSLTLPDSLTYIGEEAFVGCTGFAGKLIIPDSVVTVGPAAFYGMTGLDTIVIGRTVNSIGNTAFGGCSSLSHITFNADSCIQMYRQFSNCVNLTTLTIGDNVKIIPDDAFYGCSGLTGKLVIPDSVRSIGIRAFYECSGLDSLIIGKAVSSISYANNSNNSSFKNCSGLTYVEFNADSCIQMYRQFSNCVNLTTLTIGDNVKIIPDDAFYGCSGLTGKLVIPDSVRSIGIRAFYECSGLDSLIIGKAVSSISYANNSNNSSFKNCSGLTYVEFNADSCATMGSNNNNYVFSGCNSINKIVIGDNVKSIPNYAFYNRLELSGNLIVPNSVKRIGDYAFFSTKIDSLVIGRSVKAIGPHSFKYCDSLSSIIFNAGSCSAMGTNNDNYAFSNCNNITFLSIGKNVKAIPDYAFYNCTGLSGKLVIPDSVKTIGKYAFRNCTNFDTLVLGKSVSNIDTGSFANCTGLITIICYSENAPSIKYHFYTLTSIHSFYNVSQTIPVFIPCGSLQSYQSRWKEYTLHGVYFSDFVEFESHRLSVSSEDTLKGTVQVTTHPSCTGPAVIEATSKSFYEFTHWSDGNTDNPRTIEIAQDTVLVAFFRECTLTILPASDTSLGHIVVLQEPTAENPQAVVVAIPGRCYTFASFQSPANDWNDISYDNPFTINLTQDTIIRASYHSVATVTTSADLSGSFSICEGDSVTVTASGAESYAWTTYHWDGTVGRYVDDDTVGNTASIVLRENGRYRVRGTDSVGCQAWAGYFQVSAHRYPTVLISGKTDICAGNSTTLTAGLYKFSEDFTNGIPTEWTTNGDALEIYTLNGNSGNAILFPAYDLPENTEAELILPDINLKQFDQPSIGFKIAYYGRLSCHDVWDNTYYYWQNICDTIRNEDLRIMLSTDGGITWTEVYRASNDYSYYDYQWYVSENAYYPQNMSNSHGGWANLSNFSDYENVKIKFVFTGGQGNNMWLDDIQLYSGIYDYNLSYLWSNGGENSSQTFDDSGTYFVTVSNRIGSYWDAMQENWIQTKCSTTDSVTITVWQPDTVDITINSPNNYYVMNDETFCTSGDYTQTLQNIHGCDSVINLHLTLAPRDTVFISDTVCGGWHEIYWEESSYDTTYTVYFNGIFDETIYSIAGYGGWGEAIVYDDLYGSEYEGLIYGFHVSGEYYQNDSLWIQYDETRTLQAVSGCDSVVKKHHYVKFSDWYSLRDTACGSYVWQGDTITANPNNLNRWLYAESTNAQGCYSSVELRLTLLPAIEESVTITACDSYIWNGTTYTESGVYTYNTDTTLQETPACKLTTLHLTINPSVTELVEATACDFYTWNDSTYTTSGEYVQTFTAANGCDSTVTLQLIINESKHTDTTAESCGSYTWNETTYTTSGEYTQTFTAANGCDSTVTLHLTILPLPTPNITGVTTVCEGQTATLNATGGVSYLWEDGTTTNTYPATVSGFYTVTVTNAEGCSATASTTVTVNPLPEVAITGNTAICPGGSTVLTATGADSYMWSNGSSNSSIPVNMFGQYSVIGTSAAGCFSTASVTVLVSQPPIITISGNTDICAGESTTLTANGGVSYMWSNGSTADTLVATAAGNWQVIGYNADGCSNMASVTVNVWQPASSDLYITAFDSCYMWFGTPRCESGNYTYTLQTIHGCDSVITLHLTLEDAITTEFNATSCDSYTWNGITYSQSGNYTQNFTAVNGNDSIVTLHLTINNPVHTATTAESCSSFDWNDQTYTVSGDYTYEHLDANGCTQVDTLHLTIFNPVHTAITAGSCGSYVWNGQTYTVSGDYTYEHLDANGCTQVDTLHLTIFNPVHTAITAESCGSYYWNGQTYTESGDYTYEHLDANGCTQVDTLHLTVNDTKHVEFSDSTCTAYTWNGQTYASSGDYTQTFTAANGCDSLVTLHLTIVPTIMPVISVTGSLTACDNGSATLSVPGNYGNFVWSTGALTPTITVSEAGYYWVSATDAYGCEGVSEMVQLGGSTQIDETPAICMVDVEDSHNLLIWEELSDPDVASYHIYRENNQANVFEPLAVIPAGSVNAFADSTADPSVRAWRYKITAADTCGGETPMSGYHKTVHLTINQGLGNSWNLIWTPYEGLEFASYKLYRGTANNNLQLIQTMPATLTSYTDNNPSGDALFYQIEVVMTEGCVQHTRDITHTGARSNIVYNQVPVMAEETVSACESYDWNGQTITSSGDYTQTFVSELGYDSVVTLHLTIHHTPVFSISGNLAISQGQSTALSVPNNAGWSYLWNTGETASVIIVAPSETTSYSVTVTEGTCNASDSVTVTVNTGIDDHDGFDFTVYPNPTTNIVNVQCTMYNVQFSGTEIHIVDMYGKLVRTKPFDGETTLIDISDLANGIYFVKAVADGNVVAVRKVEKR